MITITLTKSEAMALLNVLDTSIKTAQQRYATAQENNTKMLYAMTIQGLSNIKDSIEAKYEEIK